MMGSCLINWPKGVLSRFRNIIESLELRPPSLTRNVNIIDRSSD
jgi:hypothetical protein